MVKLIVVTPKGELINDTYEMVVAKGDLGEVGILEDRLPIILRITNGFVKGVNDKKTIFAAISNGILDNSNNVVTVVSEEAQLGDTYEDAYNLLIQTRENIKNSNRNKKIDFVEAEKELAKAIKDSKASQA